jgi:hypothetical protein
MIRRLEACEVVLLTILDGVRGWLRGIRVVCFQDLFVRGN